MIKALDEAGVPHPTEIRRSSPYRPDGTVFRIEWTPFSTWLRGPWQGGDEHVAFYVHDVASEERIRVEQALLEHALPDLVDWLRQAAVAPEGWRVLKHERAWRWTAGELSLERSS